MQSVELMNRSDTKFILSLEDLLKVLPGLKEHYRILEISGIRGNHYETLYYDTPGFYFYTRHHNGKLNRLKIRKRRYVESNLNFLEVKFKTNRDQTQKDRRKLPEMSDAISAEQEDFIRRETHFDEPLEPKLWNTFQRITLVSLALRERITIDRDLSFRTPDGRSIALGNVIIAEVKQPRKNRNSPFVSALHRLHIRPQGISKYCLGVAMLHSGLKTNAFRERIRKIKSIAHEHD